MKPGRCTVDTGTITLCLLCTRVCARVLVLTDFCLFSQALPIRECSTASVRLSQLSHSPLFYIWKKTWVCPETDGDVDDHHKQKLTTASADVYARVLDLWRQLHFFGFELLNRSPALRSLCLARCAAVREALLKQTASAASPCLCRLLLLSLESLHWSHGRPRCRQDNARHS